MSTVQTLLNNDDLAEAFTRLEEAAALQEMASRVERWNAEDVEMLTRCSAVSWRLLEQAKAALSRTAGCLP
ncbi:hypothetical protein [Pseudoxanthomonas indica]|uniref:Uncharacterized protein n=1 Tax=Pseudoxanthomonas indica TaxID=428993 RepID=A0A1T5LVV2_9GAMM|nr:hypothetical protein [Pseudoxanthomonas indica]GGD40664.1 hypothetical protein GCM10007235_10860 [Pseudoxanthomonas indica]SKC80130.1 hypothetical protein SAMN06296058_3217 [Pseudoxanthomonas indica]